MSTYQEIAKACGVTTRTVRRWADKARGKYPDSPVTGVPDTVGKLHFSELEVRQILEFAPEKPSEEIFDAELIDESDTPVLNATARSFVPVDSPTVAGSLLVRYESDAQDLRTLRNQQVLAGNQVAIAARSLSKLFANQAYDELQQVKEAVVANGVNQFLETFQDRAIQ